MTVLQVAVGGIPTTNWAAGQQPGVLGGKSGELVASDLHGKWYQANINSRLFMANTLVAGTTVPIQATNLVSTFTIWNPLGSGVNVELVRYSYGVLSATTVVSDISLWIQGSVGGANAVPSALTTQLVPRPCLWAGGSVAPTANCQATTWSALTLVNTMATNMFRGPTLVTFGATTTTWSAPIVYDFDGTLILPPGTLATTAGTAAQTAAAAQSLVWAEWPV